MPHSPSHRQQHHSRHEPSGVRNNARQPFCRYRTLTPAFPLFPLPQVIRRPHLPFLATEQVADPPPPGQCATRDFRWSERGAKQLWEFPDSTQTTRDGMEIRFKHLGSRMTVGILNGDLIAPETESGDKGTPNRGMTLK